MFKNSYFRLLMNLSGLRLLSPGSEETPESAWIIPGDLSADGLKDAIHFINQAEFSPPTFEEGVLAEHQLKRKPPPPKKAAFDDDDDDDGDLDGVPLFPKGGPTVRKVIDENGKDKPKKARKKRRPLTEEEKEERRRKKKKTDHEKHMNIKSTEFVRDSDDEFTLEEDEAFFAREREIAAQAAHARATAQGEDAMVGKSARGTTLRKRARATKAAVASSDDEGSDKDDFIRKAMDGTIEEDEEGETSQDDSDGEARKRRRVSTESESEDEDEDEDEDEEMGGMDKEAGKEADKEADKADEDEDVAPVVARRPRARGGFLMDSDDDE